MQVKYIKFLILMNYIKSSYRQRYTVATILLVCVCIPAGKVAN